MELPERLPSFDELPISPDKPPRSAWGLFGDEDQIGTLNLLTPERVAAAAKLVRRGEIFALNLELELPNPPLFFREALRQTIKRNSPHTCDEIYDNFNTQASTQWDGLTHYGHRRHGFYNGVISTQVTGQEGTRNGIEHWARRGIAGRGVLVDFARWAEQQGIAFDPGKRSEITAEQLQEAARAQGITFQTGDILLVRTGWIAWYRALGFRERFLLAHTWPHQLCGLRQGEDSLRFLWDNHFAAIASDCPAFEAYPAADPDVGLMHETIIGLWGMPIGELFNLDALATDCAQDRTYEFLLTSAPLNRLGGVASPPNALAIK
jgi:hypothetical protein